MKGVELPINVLVIVSLAVIVLLGIVALFTGVFGVTGGGLTNEAALRNSCSPVAFNCEGYTADSHFKAITTSAKDDAGTQLNLWELCGALGHNTVDACKRACGCQ